MTKKTYLCHSKKIIDEQECPHYLYHYQIPIYSDLQKTQKLYKIYHNGHKIKLDFKKELREQDFKPDDVYSLVSHFDGEMTVYYK